MTADRFIYLPEIAPQFQRSVAHLREIAEAQHGVFTKKRFSDAALASYPQMTKGPGGRWGIFASQLAAYWTGLRNKNANVYEAQERFRAGRKA